MATKYVNWCSFTRLPCIGACVQDVILCLQDSALVAQPDPACGEGITTIEATICQAYTLSGQCGPQRWNYTFSFDDEQLAAPEVPLGDADVIGAFCKDCLTTWVEEQISCKADPSTLCILDSQTIDFAITEAGCITGGVRVSLEDGNIIQVFPDGIYAAGGGEGGDDWHTTGNEGTVDGTNFIGTTDDVAHDVRVNNVRIRRSEPDTGCGKIVDGGADNAVLAGVGSSILAGGDPGTGEFWDGPHTIEDGYCNLITGGRLNTILFNPSVITYDSLTGNCTIGGGGQNVIEIMEFANNSWFDGPGYGTIAGGADNEIRGCDGGTIGGGFNSYILYSVGQSNYTPVSDTIAGGNVNFILGNDQEHMPETLGFNFVGGGQTNEIDNGFGSAIVCGWDNLIYNADTIFPTNTPYSDLEIPLVNGLDFLGGGIDNAINASAYSTLTGGRENIVNFQDSSFLGGGVFNVIDNDAPVILPDPDDNGGAWLNFGVGVGNVLLGGAGNHVYNACCSSHLGGARLQIGSFSVGFLSAVNQDLENFLDDITGYPFPYIPANVNVAAFSGIAFWGDVDTWIANTDNTARKVKFFEPNTDLDFSSTHYSSFQAQAQSANIEYIWPAAAGVAGNSLKIQSVVGTTVTLEWAA